MSTGASSKSAKIAAWKREKYRTDPAYREKIKEKNKENRAKNPEVYKAIHKRWRDRNKAKTKEQFEQWVKENPEKVQAMRQRYLARPEVQERLKKWRKDNAARLRQKVKDRKAKDPSFRLACNMRARLRLAVTLQYAKKSKATFELVGCTAEELREHLESQFLPGMTWENYGRNGWHVDHIRPCCSFDLTDPEQQRACFHFTNLQPLWARDNIAKGGRQ